ncbi:hypothetical protein NM688_g426 [Phlebia brevispora]|uniref:Uncharacterized protein n=1 Tax=Phlebia brevispora TaxID=194682 RepID=A0ACC1TEL3_9APHY|nr:hypothetical protein NM688_g426 [Phlebia brevispora]
MGKMLHGLALLCVAALALSTQKAVAQSNDTFSFYTNSSDIYPLPSSPDCAEALASPIQCPSQILDALPSTNLGISNLTASDLQTLCDPSCYSSLMTIAANVDSVCGGWPFLVGDTSYVASLPFRYFAYYWNLTCLFDNSASAYCLNEAQASTSTTDQSILSLPHAQLCAFCNLQKLDVQMTSPFGWDAAFVSDWETIQSDCSFSASNAIPSGLLFTGTSTNGTATNVTATPTPVPASNSSCVFGSYTVESGDTCASIAAANSLSYDQLISVNGLDMNCTKLPPAGSAICLSGKCPLYTVQQSDTCVSIAEAESISWAQLIAWNPQFNTYCTNLATQVGKGICVGPPGGGYAPSSTVSYVTGTPTAIAVPTAPVAPGSLRDECGLWYTAVPGDTCPQILSVFGLTNDTFYELNPAVDADCDNLLAGFSYCVAPYGNATTTSLFEAPTAPGLQFIQYMSGEFPAMEGYLTDIANVTVTPSLPPSSLSTTTTTSPTSTPTIPPGTFNSSQCLSYYEVQPGDTCLAIQYDYGITLDQFISWNTEVTSDCTNLEVGLSYCVFGLGNFTPTPISLAPTSASGSPTTGSSPTISSPTSSPTPTNIAPGTITSGCAQYYTVQAGDSCGAIESNFSITLAQFTTWNPEVNNQCTNIDVGLAYCVSGPTSTSTPPTTSPTGAPLAPGTLTNCAEYYTVVSGDYCALIESNFDITFAQFQTWNTGVDSNCDNLLLGYQYCVAGPAGSTTTSTPATSPTAPGTTSQCTQYYTVQSGDTCFAIEQEFDITSTQFLSWNSGLNSDCTNLELGFQYCVAGP